MVGEAANSKSPDYRLRWAMFKIYKGTCFWCNDLLNLREMQIDHIVPRNSSKSLDTIKTLYGLSSDIEIYSYDNLVPSHPICNLDKLNELLSASPVMLLAFSRAKRHAQQIRKEIENLDKNLSAAKLLGNLTTALDSGSLTLEQLSSFIDEAAMPDNVALSVGQFFVLRAGGMTELGSSGDALAQRVEKSLDKTALSGDEKAVLRISMLEHSVKLFASALETEKDRAATFAQAERVLRELLEIIPDDLTALNMLGLVQVKSSDVADGILRDNLLKRADSTFTKASALAPNDLAVALNWAQTLMVSSYNAIDGFAIVCLSRAVTVLESASVYHPHESSIYEKWGQALFRLGQLQTTPNASSTLRLAVEKFRQASRLDPADELVSAMIGTSLLSLSMMVPINEKAALMSEAERAFRDGISKSPNYAKALVGLAQVLYGNIRRVQHGSKHQFDECLELYRRALGAVPNGDDDRSWIQAEMLRLFTLASRFSLERSKWISAGESLCTELQNLNNASVVAALAEFIGVKARYQFKEGLQDSLLEESEKLTQRALSMKPSQTLRVTILTNRIDTLMECVPTSKDPIAMLKRILDELRKLLHVEEHQGPLIQLFIATTSVRLIQYLQGSPEFSSTLRDAERAFRMVAPVYYTNVNYLECFGVVLLERFKRETDAATAKSTFDEAKSLFMRLDLVEPGSGSYHLAQISALESDRLGAKTNLDQAERLGKLPNHKAIEGDPHLESLRGVDWFETLLGRARMREDK